MQLATRGASLMDIKTGRYTADYPDDFVVFLIGMRINKLRRLSEWWPVFRGSLAMQKETLALPGSPMLASRALVEYGDPRSFVMIQYWRSFEELESWANAADLRHRPAQKKYFQKTGSNGNVGVWHETFRVTAGEFEAIYVNLHRFGLAAAGEHVPLRGPMTARQRLEAPPLTLQDRQPEEVEESL
jgi:hypothetical protein